MVDQEGRVEEQRPAEQISGDDRIAREAGRGVPDDSTDRLPPEEQRDERQRAEQHVGAALNRFGHEARPPALERRARHQAVLDGEQAEQAKIDRQRLPQRSAGGSVEPGRGQETADEPDGVEKHAEKQAVAQDAIGQRAYSGLRKM